MEVLKHFEFYAAKGGGRGDWTAKLYETPTKRPHSIYPRRFKFFAPPVYCLRSHRFARNFVDTSEEDVCGVTRDNRARFPINGRRRGEIHRNDRTTNFPLFRRNGEREGRRIVPIMNDNGKISISKNLEIDTTLDTRGRLRICPVNFARGEREDGKSSIRFQARNREKIRDSTSSRNGI